MLLCSNIYNLLPFARKPLIFHAVSGVFLSLNWKAVGRLLDKNNGFYVNLKREKLKMYLIGPKNKYLASSRFALVFEGIDYLLIHQLEAFFLIENKCGHLGILLSDADLEPNTIICKGHGISFDLTTGQIINRPYENCDALKVFEVVEIDGNLFFNANEKT